MHACPSVTIAPPQTGHLGTPESPKITSVSVVVLMLLHLAIICAPSWICQRTFAAWRKSAKQVLGLRLESSWIFLEAGTGYEMSVLRDVCRRRLIQSWHWETGMMSGVLGESRRELYEFGP